MNDVSGIGTYDPRIAVRPVEAGRYPKKIAAAILAITRALEPIAKEGRNAHFGYNYARWEDIDEKIGPLLAEHGLIIEQDEQCSYVISHEGMAGTMLRIIYNFVIVNEDGEAWPVKQWSAISRLSDSRGGIDDKAAAKCHTQAHKYWLIRQFKIRVEEAKHIDGDADGAIIPQRTETRTEPKALPSSRRGEREPTVLRGRGSKDWLRMFKDAVAQSLSVESVKAWRLLNADSLGKLETMSSDKTLHPDALAAIDAKLRELEGKAPPAAAEAPAEIKTEPVDHVPPAAVVPTAEPAAPAVHAAVAPAKTSEQLFDDLDISEGLRRLAPSPVSFDELKDRVIDYAGKMTTLNDLGVYFRETVEPFYKHFDETQVATLRAIESGNIKRIQDIETAARLAAKPEFSIDQWRKDLEVALVDASTMEQLGKIKTDRLLPHKATIEAADALAPDDKKLWPWAVQSFTRTAKAIEAATKKA